MLEVIASLSGAAVFVVSLLVRAVSTQPRMLGHIRNEAETLKALPEDHPGRDALALELAVSVERYTAYRARSRERYRLGVGLTILAAGAILGLMELALDSLDQDVPFQSTLDVVSTVVIVLGSFAGFGYILSWLIPVLKRVDEVLDPEAAADRQQRKLERSLRKGRGGDPE